MAVAVGIIERTNSSSHCYGAKTTVKRQKFPSLVPPTTDGGIVSYIIHMLGTFYSILNVTVTRFARQINIKAAICLHR